MILQNHLAEKHFIHRDLAARNILVGSDNRVSVRLWVDETDLRRRVQWKEYEEASCEMDGPRIN